MLACPSVLYLGFPNSGPCVGCLVAQQLPQACILRRNAVQALQMNDEVVDMLMLLDYENRPGDML